ncbi:hypothetical protein AB3S75_009159 [Citrus x aurantiifolia]
MADIEEQNETKFSNLDGRPKRRNQTKKKHLLKRSVDDKVIVQYNHYGVPVGDGANDFRSYIGVLVRDNVSILYDDWQCVPLEIKDKFWDHLQTKFELDIRSKKHVVQSMGIALRNFRCALNTEFIQPNKDNRSQLKLPPWEYPKIRKLEWKQFVDKVLSPEFEKDEITVSEKELDRSQLWLMARKNNKGGYEPDVLTVVEKIDELKSEVDQGSFQTHGVNDILSAALGKQPNGSRVQRLGKLITPTMYFHIPNTANLLEQRMAIERKAVDIIEEDSLKNGQSTAKTKVIV